MSSQTTSPQPPETEKVFSAPIPEERINAGIYIYAKANLPRARHDRTLLASVAAASACASLTV